MLEIKNIHALDNRGVLGGISAVIAEKGIYGFACAHSGDLQLFADALCGCCDITYGSIAVNGNTVGDMREIRRKIHQVPAKLILHRETTSWEYLDFVGNALKIDSEKKYRQMKEAIEFVGLDGNENLCFVNLNPTDRFRLSLAAAIMGNPDCIVIADSLSHIWPDEFMSVAEIIRTLGKHKTIIIASTSVGIIKKLCSHIDIICGGRVVLSGDIRDIESKINATKEVNITARGDSDTVINTVKECVDSVIDIRCTATSANAVSTYSVEYRSDTKIKDKLYNVLTSVNIPMLSYREIVLKLDDVFFSLTAEDKERAEKEERKK